jgi:hypothetical protein
LLGGKVALELTDGERARWIESHIIQPARKLFEVLGPDFERIRSKWPDEEYDPAWMNIYDSRVALQRLINWAKDKQHWLLHRQKPKVKLGTDFRFALVFDLLQIYVAVFPERLPSRISHNAGTKNISLIQSEFAEFVRAAAAPILGVQDNLDDQIKVAIQKYRELQKTAQKKRAILS